MISLISPAKSMDFEQNSQDKKSNVLKQNTKTDELIKKLQSLSANELSKIMGISEKIAELNYQRFQNYKSLPEKQALFAYNGDVYKNINVTTLSPLMLQFADKHLGIISALYGLLSPLDNIKPYRLEMVCNLPGVLEKNLANYWKKEITKQVNIALKEHKNKFVINIASNEYSAAIDQSELDAPLINIHFREIRNGVIKNIAINSKKARGLLADYIIRNGIDTPEEIKSFSKKNYHFDESISDTNNYYFVSHSKSISN